jgi:hypothetical protein
MTVRVIPQHKISRKAKKNMEERYPEGYITDPRNTSLEETSWG